MVVKKEIMVVKKEMSERDRGDLTEMIDLLYKLDVLPSFGDLSRGIDSVMVLFEKYGHYTNYN